MNTIASKEQGMGKCRKAYIKPEITLRQKVEALAAVCDSAWKPSGPCRLLGNPGCQWTRF